MEWPEPATVAFLLAFTLCSLALGAVSLALPRFIPLPTMARTLFGVSLTPFILGFSMLGSTWLWPGGPQYFHLGLPLVLAGLTLLWRGRLLLHVLSSTQRRLLHWNRARFVALLCVLPMIYPTTLLIDHALDDTRAPIIAFDALQYLRQAEPLAATGDAKELIGFAGNDEGTLRGDLHHPAWPAYLAYALQFTPGGTADPAVDHVAGVAIQICFFLMLVALLTLALALKMPLVWPFASALLLMIPQFDYVVNSFSRDAWRIIPVLLCAAVLVRFRPRGVWHIRSLASVVIANGVMLVGHTLGGFVALALGSAWGLWQLLNHGRLNCIAAVALATVLGLGLGATHHVQTVMSTGSFTGEALVDDAVAGTLYEPRLAKIWQADLPLDSSTTYRITTLATRDGHGIGIAGLLLALTCVLLLWIRRPNRYIQGLTFLALVNLLMFIEFTGLIDWFGYKLSDWFMTNRRYVLHWNALNAAFLGTVIAVFCSQIAKRSVFAADLAAVSIAVVLCLCAGQTLQNQWYRNTWGPEYLETTLHNVRIATQNLEPEHRLLLEDARWNWYLGNRHLLMYTRPTHPLFRAENCVAVWSLLDQLRVGGVVLVKSSLDVWWADTVLLDCLENDEFRRMTTEDDMFAIYVRTSAN